MGSFSDCPQLSKIWFVPFDSHSPQDAINPTGMALAKLTVIRATPLASPSSSLFPLTPPPVCSPSSWPTSPTSTRSVAFSSLAASRPLPSASSSPSPPPTAQTSQVSPMLAASLPAAVSIPHSQASSLGWLITLLGRTSVQLEWGCKFVSVFL